MTGTCRAMWRSRKQSLLFVCVLRKQLPAGVTNALLIISLLPHPFLVVNYFNSKGRSGKKEWFHSATQRHVSTPGLFCGGDGRSVQGRCCVGLRMETQRLDRAPKCLHVSCTSAVPPLRSTVVLGGIAFGCPFDCFHLQT